MVIKTYGIEQIGKHTVLLIEDIQATSITEVLSQKDLDVKTCLRLAIKTCDALSEIHRNNVIHKDINPNNIIWNETTDELKIIDFNISTTLSREVVEAKNPNVLEGTLPYLSPEQTGRMNRAIDYRSDFYGLGATLYHMLTGGYPFEAKDALGYVHAHIALIPKPLDGLKEEIPFTLSNIVLKLMSKNAEDRYQSALGLKEDLQRCLNELQEKGSINPFELAQEDKPDKFQFPQKLYGREEAIGTLLETVNRVNEGTEEILLVKGYSGIGKTALVQEVYKPLTAKKGYLISGKFDQLQKDVPYLAFLQAFEGLVKQLLTESDEELAKWKEKLLEALKSNGKVMTEVIPSLVQIIGEQPEVPEVPPEQAKNRFNYVFQNFIATLAKPEHPLTIFLDDLQWADAASLNLIEQMFAQGDKKTLLLIGAYRDNEVDSVHPLTHSLNTLTEAGATVTTITLTPLKQEHLQEILVDALHQTKEKVVPLAELLQRKTGGNPFFIREFLKSLYIEQLIRFNYPQRHWEWDTKEIEARGYTENVIELMAGKLEALPANTHKLLALAGYIGNNFDLSTLAAIITDKDTKTSSQESSLSYLEGLIGLTEGNIYSDLRSALVEGYILQQGEQFTFAHDRIQQAAYELIPKDNREAIHFRIGKSLLASTTKEELETKVFAIVDHFNAAKNLPEISSIKEELINLNTRAGHKATKAGAYAAALNYFQQAMEHLPNNHWESLYDKSLDIYNNAMQAALLSGILDPIEEWFKQVRYFAKTPLDKYFAYATKIRLLTIWDKLDEIIECAQEIIRSLGFRLPKNPTKLELAWHLVSVKSMLLFKNIGLTAITPFFATNKPKVVAYLQIMSQIYGSAYTTGKLDVLVFIVTVGVKLQLCYGPISSFLFAGLGSLLSSGFGDIRNALKLREMAQELQSENSSGSTATNFLINCFINHLEIPLSQVAQNMHKSIVPSLDLGNKHYTVWTLIMGYVYRILSGDSLQELISGLEIDEKFINSYSEPDAIYAFQLSKSFIMCLNGKSSLEQEFSVRDFRRDVLTGNRVFKNDSVQATLVIWLFFLEVFFDEYRSAREFGWILDKVQNGLLGTASLQVGYMKQAISNLQLAKPNNLRKTLRYVASKQKYLKHLSKHAPMNYLHKWHLVEAERCRVIGKRGRAWHHYQEATRLARENGFVNEEALALELTAKFYLESNLNLAHHFLREAYDAYSRWGALAKLKHLENKYPEVFLKTTTSSTSSDDGIIQSSSHTGTSTEKLDLVSILKASQTLSGEIQLPNLIEKLMHTLVASAGADRGALLIPKNNDWLLAAQFSASDNQFIESDLVMDESETLIPLRIVHYAINTQKHIITDLEGEQDFSLQDDSYAKSAKPQSMMVLPLSNQGNLEGVVYLENKLAKGAFTDERLAVLKHLAAQAAISLKNAQLLAELQENMKQLRQARQRITKAEDRQRKELAERLHGSVQTRLSVAWRNLGNCIKELKANSAAKQISEALESIREELDNLRETEVRQVSHSLHPAIVSIGLVPAIRSLIDNKPEEMEIKLEVTEEIEELDDIIENLFSEEVRLGVYRIVEEAIGNVYKHAVEATKVIICLERQDNNLKVLVRDNGKGFDEGKFSKRLGLMSVDDRVQQLGGSWSISQEGAGILLEASIPIRI